jgi:uncharacterized protein (DUF1778 family)
MVKVKRKHIQTAAKALKDDVLRIRIPGEQKQALLAAAERDGLDLSAWVRQAALRAAGVLPTQ